MSEIQTSAPSAELLTPLQQLIEMGGPVMMVLVALAIAGLVTFFYLILAGALFAPRFTADIRRNVNDWRRNPGPEYEQQMRGARSWYQRLNPLRPLVGFAMKACMEKRNPVSLREELACRSQKVLQPFEAPLKIIEVIAALAPLLGLLGTVMGMMEAFSAMSASEGRASATQLSGGIYEALTTTAAGLVLAIPFAALAAWVEFRLRRMNTRLNELLIQVVTATAGSEEVGAAFGPVQKPAAAADDDQWQKRRIAHATG
ncbi:MotA/TolQ/ExbB proton channel family protein [Marinobacter sp.]|uniref:MotA/TolQ/ExbB proton channel family protein n=1 Tax=Marinobacter sp. TaxID=50741 RepID=UPI00384F9AF2